MSEKLRQFRQRLLSGEALIGTWVKTPSPVVCEVLAQSTLDLLALDAEHGPFGRGDIDGCLGITRLSDKPTLVRVPSAEPAHILNALDCGASGVIIPHVTSAADARQVVQASHYGGGGRGYAGSSRSAGYGTSSMTQQLTAAADHTAVVVMIEDLEAIEAIDDIAAVEGVDCLFVGRIDLTVAMGASSPGAAEVIEAVEKVCAAGVKHNRRVGMFVSDPGEVSRWQDAGASLFILSSDHSFLAAGANALTAQFRG